ncbi:MAG TPA: hypothetical protein PLP31_13500 [Thermoanaerobaculaceae bacterium]|nr:hypothetical protein [Thermoanaerobaculaceae bacterium]
MAQTFMKARVAVLSIALIGLGPILPGGGLDAQNTEEVFILPADGPAIPTPAAEELAAGTAPPIDAAGTYLYLVPTSGHLPGFGGAFWVTDMVIHNPGPSIATVNIYFMKQNQNNSAAVGQTFMIPASRSLKLKDVVKNTFGQSSTSGALLIGSNVALLVASRTFNDQPAGTFGQYVPGQAAATLVSGTAPARLIQLTRNALYLTNIGFANMTASATPITVTLYHSSGALAGVLAEVIDPWGYRQINDVFAKAGAGTADDAYAVVTSTLATAKYFTYASVRDNRTADPITVIPVEPASAATARPAEVPAQEVPEAGTVTVFSDNFEGSFPSPNWTLRFVSGKSNTTVNWGRSSYRKAGGSYSVWCVGSGSGAPAPGGNYPPNMGAWMQYGPFSLAGATSAKVELDLWLSKQTGKDVFGVWAATSANGQYSSVYVDPANTGGTWRHETVPLDNFAGAPQVWLAITFTSDGSTQYEGAYVDNLVITKTVACGAPPTPVAAAPATASSDSTYTVSWSNTSPENRYEIQEADNASFTGAATFAVSATSRSFAHTVTSPTTYHYRVRALACSPTVGSPWSVPRQTLVSPTAPPASSALWVPGTAALTGIAGSNWRTDLEIHNPGAASATYEVALLKRDQNNPSPQTAIFSLEGGRSMRYGNILSLIFGYSGAATLRITPTAGAIMVTSRTYNDQPAGTFGQFVPGRGVDRAIAYGSTGRLLMLSQSTVSAQSFRTNLGLVNATGSTITVEVDTYRGADGLHLGLKSYSLGPFKSIQLNEFLKNELAAGSIDDAFALVRTTTPGGVFFAFASVIDNRSNDPIYVPAEVAQ